MLSNQLSGQLLSCFDTVDEQGLANGEHGSQALTGMSFSPQHLLIIHTSLLFLACDNKPLDKLSGMGKLLGEDHLAGQ